MLTWGKLRISAGFLLLLGWFILANGIMPLLAVLTAALCHECGHYAALCATGSNMNALEISVLGAVIEMDSRKLSYAQELLVTIAGPLSNFLCAVFLTFLPAALSLWMNTPADEKISSWCRILTGANIILGLYNLLPVRCLDGGKALYLLLSWLGNNPALSEQITAYCTMISAAVMAVLLGLLIWQSGGSLWLLPSAAGLALNAWQERK